MNCLPMKITPRRDYVHTLSTTENEDMTTLLHHLGNSSYTWLLWNRNTMHEYQKKLGSLHPLTFIEMSVMDQGRLENLKKIRQSSKLIWGSFSANIRANLTQEESSGNLECHIDEFANRINLPTDEVRNLVKNKDLSTLFDLAIEAQSK